MQLNVDASIDLGSWLQVQVGAGQCCLGSDSASPIIRLYQQTQIIIAHAQIMEDIDNLNRNKIFISRTLKIETIYFFRRLLIKTFMSA